MTEKTSPERKRRDLTQGPLPRTLLSLAFPIMAAHALGYLYGLTDLFWLGRLHEKATFAQAAVLPAIALMSIANAFGMGFGSGGAALVSQHIGAKRHEEADAAAGQNILLVTCTTTTMAVLIFLLAPQALRLLNTPDDVMQQAVPFLRVFLCCLPLHAINIGYGSSLRAMGDTVTMVTINFCANIVNFVLSPVLIFGVGPFPELGIKGAAMANVFSAMLTAATSIILLRRGRSGLRLTRAHFRPDFGVIRVILRIGLPAGVSGCSNSLGLLVLQGMIGALGATVMAAWGIGSRITDMISVPANSLAIATSPVVGQALGANKPELARRAVRTSVKMYAFGLLGPQIFLIFAGQLIARGFTKDENVIKEAGLLFLLVPTSHYCFNILTVLMSAFQGSGHTRPIMVISLLRLWVLRMPICWLLCFGWWFVPPFGSVGLYTGLAVSNLIAAILAWWIFRMGDWAKPVVAAREASS